MININSKARIFHCLQSQQFDRELLDHLCVLADKIRDIARSKKGMEYLMSLLNHKRAMLYFVQPSTRTFLSFYSACQILGVQCAEVRDTRTSSEVKGESEEDTVRTFSSYFDFIIMRHSKANFADKIARLLDDSDRSVPIINAGSGKDQHPTQALLDIYTLQRSFLHRGTIDGLKIAFVGDLVRGRTCRSLAALLSRYEGVKQYFVAPEPYQMGSDILKLLDEAGSSYEVVEDFASVIPEVDAIYMTRMQDEWDKEDGVNHPIDIEKYSFGPAQLPNLKPDAILMHPLPRRKEMHPDVDKDPRAAYWRQVRNGMWARVALIAATFGTDRYIDDYYNYNY